MCSALVPAESCCAVACACLLRLLEILIWSRCLTDSSGHQMYREGGLPHPTPKPCCMYSCCMPPLPTSLPLPSQAQDKVSHISMAHASCS